MVLRPDSTAKQQSTETAARMDEGESATSRGRDRRHRLDEVRLSPLVHGMQVTGLCDKAVQNITYVDTGNYRQMLRKMRILRS